MEFIVAIVAVSIACLAVGFIAGFILATVIFGN